MSTPEVDGSTLLFTGEEVLVLICVWVRSEEVEGDSYSMGRVRIWSLKCCLLDVDHVRVTNEEVR